jgi:hypothetical protein
MAFVFQEGEPLNVSALNEMSTRLSKLDGTLSAMTKAGDIVEGLLGSSVPIITGNRESVDLVANGVVSINIADKLSKKYTGNTENPWIIVGLGGKLNAKEVVSATVHGTGLQKTIYVTSNVKKDNFGIYWIAVYMRPITTT